MNMAICYNCPHLIDTDAEDYEVLEGVDGVEFMCEQCVIAICKEEKDDE